MWLDAGDVINKPFQSVVDLAREYGVFTVPSKGSVKDMTHEDTLKEMLPDKSLQNKPMLNGAVLVFDILNKTTVEFLER